MADGSEGPASKPSDLSRRTFLRGTGAAVAGVAVVGFGFAATLKGVAFPSIAEASGVIMPDPTLCIGCLTCEIQCSQVHKAAGLSSLSRIRVFRRDSVAVNPQVIAQFGDRGRFFQNVCVQCPDAPCVGVCPVKALHVDSKSGARVINPDTCIACGKCEQACLFPTPPESEAVAPEKVGQKSRITYDKSLNVYTKCDLCSFRPEGPACIERCPVNLAIKQGTVKSDVMCLDLLKPENKANFAKMRDQQTAPQEAK
jgi:Fe-S-cluster-containing hydrogenase component 2